MNKFVRNIWDSFPDKIQFAVRKGIGKMSFITDAIYAHDQIYDDDYYQFVDEHAQPSAPIIANSILAAFDPSTVLDVGCGSGAMMQELEKRGVAVKGLEYSQAALQYCQKRSLDVLKFDLEGDKSLSLASGFDVVISLEVAEHLPEQAADRYVNLLCKNANTIIFTAATPGQGGTNHVNEQPHSYWIQKFAAHDYNFLRLKSIDWRNSWEKKGTAEWYYSNLMIFKK